MFELLGFSSKLNFLGGGGFPAIWRPFGRVGVIEGAFVPLEGGDVRGVVPLDLFPKREREKGKEDKKGKGKREKGKGKREKRKAKREIRVSCVYEYEYLIHKMVCLFTVP